MEHDHFASFPDINLVDETSFEEFYNFYFRMIGIYTGKTQAYILLPETGW